MAGTSPAEFSSQLVTGLNQLILQLILILVLAQIYTFMHCNYNEYFIPKYMFLLGSCNNSTVSKHFHNTRQLLISCVFFNQRREHHPCILWASPHCSEFKKKRRRQKQGNMIHFKKFVFKIALLSQLFTVLLTITLRVRRGGRGPR